MTEPTRSTSRLDKSEEDRVRAMSDAALRYIAPMLCGSAERAELIRRAWSGRCWVCGAATKDGNTVCDLGAHKHATR